jgi:single-stranded DNA-specific DHH superfamily exonuclease
MAQIDIFNGDADGICALTQLRNAEPMESTLITGVKRDIALVAKAGAAAGDRITVLDLSFDKNRDGVLTALEAGAEVFYVDHHFAGDIPESDKLTTIIDPDPNVCTSLLINGYLKGAHVEWAVTGAFGDNLEASARTIAAPLGLSEEKLRLLENLGIYMNYNGYGSSLEDLHFAPAELFDLVRPYPTPFAFVEGARESFEKLETGYRQDMASAGAVKPTRQTEKTAVFVLPNEAWARRVSGVYSNDLANASPSRAHAVLTERPDGTYLVSVRAPVENKQGADELCRRFPTGGGRAAAAGINALPGDQLEAFIAALAASYP